MRQISIQLSTNDASMLELTIKEYFKNYCGLFHAKVLLLLLISSHLVLKSDSDLCTEPLAQIFNDCIWNSTFPDELKCVEHALVRLLEKFKIGFDEGGKAGAVSPKLLIALDRTSWLQKCMHMALLTKH